MSTTRVTVTLPDELVRAIDAQDANRSRFVLAAVRRELEKRRRDALRASLHAPHPETLDMAEQGLAEWARGLPAENVDDLVDTDGGRAVKWIPGEGWKARRK